MSFRLLASALAGAAVFATAGAVDAQAPEVAVVVAVGQRATFAVADFQPRTHLEVWALETPSFSTGLCLNQAMPQSACGIDVGSWRADSRGRATVSFRWPAYLCTRGTRTRRCRRRPWRHGTRAIVAVYSSNFVDEAEARVLVR
jgi:hypothetical protein